MPRCCRCRRVSLLLLQAWAALEAFKRTPGMRVEHANDVGVTLALATMAACRSSSYRPNLSLTLGQLVS